MTSNGASPLPGPDMTMKPGTALSPFTALPIPPSAPGPPELPPWDLSPQPPMPSAFSPGNPLMLSAFPNPLLVTGEGGPGHGGTEAGKIIFKVKTEVRAAEPSQTQNLILTQTAHNWIASGAPCGGPEGPSPQFVTASNLKTLLPTEAVGVSQESLPGLPAQVPAPAAQLAPIVPLEKAWPGPHGATGGERGLPVAQSKPSPGDLSYTSKGVYENFRRWQRYKALARRHLSQSPDAEALSCFLIPVLRSLARLKPTLTLEEGLPRAVQEWDRTSNFDRMIFYEMAEKFMEFEAEEEMQNQNRQLMNGSQGLPPAAPLKLDPPGPRAPEVCQQPVYIPKKAASRARAPRRRQRKARPPVPEAPREIPPEAVKEYTDIMEGLVGSHLATGEADGRQEEEELQQEEGMYPDPDLLSYMDELCSHEVFVSKVEAVIHPQFLADLLSPEQQRDPLALMEELEQEERLSLAQAETGNRGSSISLLETIDYSNILDVRDGCGLQYGVSEDTCLLNSNSCHPQGEGREDTDLLNPKHFAPLPGNQESYVPGPPKPTSPPRVLGRTSPRWGTRAASVLKEASPVSETCSTADGPRGGEEEEEEDEELSCFAYLLASKLSLSPRRPPLGPHPASGLSSPGGQGVQRPSRSLSAEARGSGHPPYPVAKPRKRALVAGPVPAEKKPHPGAEPVVSGEKPLARPSQPRKRRRDSLGTGRRKKRRRTQ
uniref:NUT midline carcinoma family member 1 n=1 Tax=Molossus molossus TaxID=27622 RepID=A0A7J8JXW9_MOLMO|nr:NUT midline carcinoma family member 1 [Molossus molossus]